LSDKKGDKKEERRKKKEGRRKKEKRMSSKVEWSGLADGCSGRTAAVVRGFSAAM
jgi:hypothetical protein